MNNQNNYPNMQMQEPRKWRHGYCSCCDRGLISCCYSCFWCPCCASCDAVNIVTGRNQRMRHLGLCCFSSCCTGDMLHFLPYYMDRKDIKEELDIQEDGPILDLIYLVYCPCLAASQAYNEAKDLEKDRMEGRAGPPRQMMGAMQYAANQQQYGQPQQQPPNAQQYGYASQYQQHPQQQRPQQVQMQPMQNHNPQPRPSRASQSSAQRSSNASQSSNSLYPSPNQPAQPQTQGGPRPSQSASRRFSA